MVGGVAADVERARPVLARGLGDADNAALMGFYDPTVLDDSSTDGRRGSTDFARTAALTTSARTAALEEKA